MRADALAALRAIMRGDLLAESHVTPATPVTLQPGYRLKAPELQAFQPLQVETGSDNKSDDWPATAAVTALPDPDEAAIEERAGLAADRLPVVYLDAWARLNCQKPARASEAEWRLALDDGGQLIDAWGADAATFGWAAGDLFDVPGAGRPGGLVWQLKGDRVEALCVASARIPGGRAIRLERE
jgi:hypothetical protein